MPNLKIWDDNLSEWRYVSYLVPTSELSVYTWVIEDPSVEGIPGCRLPDDATAVRINSFVTAATSATFNIEIRSTVGSAGSNLLSSDQVATTSGAEATSLQNTAIDAGDWLWLDISAVSGTPGTLTVSLTLSS
jgi:hypothetical protein